jgi:hypothetical protein
LLDGPSDELTADSCVDLAPASSTVGYPNVA